MMKIKIKELSTEGLLRLLRDVAVELDSRRLQLAQQATGATSGKVVSEPDPKMAALLHSPDAVDADFCLMIAARVKSGGYVKAHERERVASIAKDFPLWVARQGLPATHNAGDWKRSISSVSAPRAVER